jgi:hypothetical protein
MQLFCFCSLPTVNIYSYLFLWRPYVVRFLVPVVRYTFNYCVLTSIHTRREAYSNHSYCCSTQATVHGVSKQWKLFPTCYDVLMCDSSSTTLRHSKHFDLPFGSILKVNWWLASAITQWTDDPKAEIKVLFCWHYQQDVDVSIKEQTKIGWEHFFRGYISGTWGHISTAPLSVFGEISLADKKKHIDYTNWRKTDLCLKLCWKQSASTLLLSKPFKPTHWLSMAPKMILCTTAEVLK